MYGQDAVGSEVPNRSPTGSVDEHDDVSLARALQYLELNEVDEQKTARQEAVETK